MAEDKSKTQPKTEQFADLPESFILEGYEPDPYPIGADKSKISVADFETFRGAGVILGAFDPVGESITARHTISVMSAKKLLLDEGTSKEIRDDTFRRLTELRKFLNDRKKEQ